MQVIWNMYDTSGPVYITPRDISISQSGGLFIILNNIDKNTFLQDQYFEYSLNKSYKTSKQPVFQKVAGNTSSTHATSWGV